jgi:hypothetical protein
MNAELTTNGRQDEQDLQDGAPAPLGPFDFHHQRLSAFISGFL